MYKLIFSKDNRILSYLELETIEVKKGRIVIIHLFSI